MTRFFLSILILFIAKQITAQIGWEYLADLPFPISNNAVASAEVNDTLFLYSFAGIDSTKKWSGIHNKTMRYNTITNKWDQLEDLPSGNARIAAGASNVKGKIYIIGGYEVRFNGDEISYDKVHRFDPHLNAYLADGTPVPRAIDDHVQAVWRDSLIYVITGWSNNTNVVDVQIYNPSTDEWLQGTSVPGSSRYRVFGASGSIVNDTIYYIGGAKLGSSFPVSNYLRKGAIDPNNPTNITWSESVDSLSIGYRMGASTWNNIPFWYGGSEVTYNYNGIAYNGSGGVNPSNNATFYDNFGLHRLSSEKNDLPEVMDLRGIAKGAQNEYYIIGGMIKDQIVSNKLIKLEITELSNAKDIPANQEVLIYPNPSCDITSLSINDSCLIRVISVEGKQLQLLKFVPGDLINFSFLESGLYFLQIEKEGGEKQVLKLIKK